MNSKVPLIYLPKGNRPKPSFCNNNPLHNLIPNLGRKLCLPDTQIIHKMGPGYVGTTDFPFSIWNAKVEVSARTGTLGSGSLFNSPFSSGQLLMALLVPHGKTYRPHQEIMGLLANRFILLGEADVEALRRSQVLSGLKILDLGCGEIPSFARAARKLGAEVYTADVISADGFKSSPEYFSEQERELEERMHIHCNLNSSDALRIIGERSGGFFDFVTEALLDIPI